MEAVDVLFGLDRLDHLLGVDLRRQRQLHEDAVDLRIGIELADDVQELGLARRRRQRMVEGAHPRLEGVADLVADVDLARRVVADENDGEAGDEPLPVPGARPPRRCGPSSPPQRPCRR